MFDGVVELEGDVIKVEFDSVLYVSAYSLSCDYLFEIVVFFDGSTGTGFSAGVSFDGVCLEG